jgi:hypothetical protein
VKALRVGAFVLLTLVLGDVLARCLSGLPFEAPALTGSAQWLLRTLSPADVHNPDTVELIAGVLLLTASATLVAIVLWIAVRILRLWIARQRQS